MKLKSSSLTAIAALALADSTFAAATVSYSYYTASGQSDTSWVNVTGYDSIVGPRKFFSVKVFQADEEAGVVCFC